MDSKDSTEELISEDEEMEVDRDVEMEVDRDVMMDSQEEYNSEDKQGGSDNNDDSSNVGEGFRATQNEHGDMMGLSDGEEVWKNDDSHPLDGDNSAGKYYITLIGVTLYRPINDILKIICADTVECENCGKPAYAYCEDCGNSYCQGCSTTRHKMARRRHHMIMRLSGIVPKSTPVCTKTKRPSFVINGELHT